MYHGQLYSEHYNKFKRLKEQFKRYNEQSVSISLATDTSQINYTYKVLFEELIVLFARFSTLVACSDCLLAFSLSRPRIRRQWFHPFKTVIELLQHFHHWLATFSNWNRNCGLQKKYTNTRAKLFTVTVILIRSAV